MQEQEQNEHFKIANKFVHKFKKKNRQLENIFKFKKTDIEALLEKCNSTDFPLLDFTKSIKVKKTIPFENIGISFKIFLF